MFSERELFNMAVFCDKLIAKHVRRASKWNGKIVVVPDFAPNAKNWDCSLQLCATNAASIVMHELLHARSVSYFSQAEYNDHSNIEEFSVQLLNQEICLKEDIKIIESAYDEYVFLLRQINKLAKLKETDYEFAKWLFAVPLDKRFGKLQEEAFKNLKTVRQAKELNKIIEQIDEWRR